MEEILILMPFLLTLLCFIGMVISDVKYQKSRYIYIKWIRSNWNKQI
jgi:hypothetical protein